MVSFIAYLTALFSDYAIDRSHFAVDVRTFRRPTILATDVWATQHLRTIDTHRADRGGTVSRV